MIELPPASRAALLEEAGGDLRYGLDGAPAQREIATRPPRLGAIALPLQARRLSLMLRAEQASAAAIVRIDCLDPAAAAFHARIEALYLTAVEKGESATALIDPLEQEAGSADPYRRAWLLNVRANALLAAGKVAGEAFLATSQAMAEIGDDARAGVALYAAAEDLSRKGELDVAQRRFHEAIERLRRSGPLYYALRAEASLCLLHSRRGDVRAAIECGEQLLPRMDAARERSEAAIQRITLANQHLKLGELDRARDLLLAVDQDPEGISPTGRARLNEAFGNLYVRLGDLSTAAREYAQASAHYAQAGLPSQQSIIDLRLARLAAISGAHAEERELLGMTIATLRRQQSREFLAEALIMLAVSEQQFGRLQQATAALEEARATCVAIEKLDCLERVDLQSAALELMRDNAAAAKGLLEAHPTPLLAVSKRERERLLASVESLEGHHAQALRRLESLTAEADPDAPQLALERAGVLVRSGRSPEARELLQLALAKAAPARVDTPVALRLARKTWIARMQSAWFDLLDTLPGEPISMPLTVALRQVLHAGAPSAPGSPDAARLLSEAQRRALSDAVLDPQSGDPRADYLAFLSIGSGVASEIQSFPPQSLPAGTLLLVPAIGAREFRLLLQSGAEWRMCRRMPRSDYDTAVARFGRALDQPVPVADLDREAGRWLALIQGCAPDAAAAQRWWVLATPGAPQLPWEWVAASAGDAEPALSWTFTLPGESRPANLPKPPAALVMNLDLEGAEALPFAAAELDRVQSAFARAGVRSIQPRTPNARSLLEAASGEGHWVHLIGHGNSPARGPLYAGLWLRGRERPELLPYPDIAALPSRAALVVLSACGAGPASSSPSSVNLQIAEAFVSAGAGEIIAASNPLSDSAGPVWVSSFYEHMLRDGNPAIALREARRRLRESPHFRHPRFWAGLNHFQGTGPS